jgi:enoyl-CoA hydratase/carnithine racemase
VSDITLYEVDDGVAWLTMNRPEAHNALSQDLRDGIRDGFTRFRDDETAKVLVLTGAGDKAFSAGGDLKEMAETQLKVPPPDFIPSTSPSSPPSTASPTAADSCWPRCATCASPPTTPGSGSPRPAGAGGRPGVRRCRG